MKKTKKALIIIIATLIIGLPSILISAVAIHDIVIAAIPDYKLDKYIPKGFSATDGESGYGAGDLMEYDYYVFDDEPELNKAYKTVDSGNKKELYSALERFGDSLSTSNTEFRNGIYKRVSAGDMFILKYFAPNGDETDFSRDNCQIYFYDTESKILFKIRYIW